MKTACAAFERSAGTNSILTIKTIITMADWATTNYVIEGSDEDLKKISNAIKNHQKSENASDNWEGDILKALDISFGEKTYTRGFLWPDTLEEGDGCISFMAEEAWGVTDFAGELKKAMPNISIFWCSEEPNNGYYATNDSKGRHFTERFFAEVCINDEPQSEYFSDEKSAREWIEKLTGCKNYDEYDAFGEDNDDYITFHSFSIVNYPK